MKKIIAAVLLTFAGVANAGILTFASQDDFAKLGTITQTLHFDETGPRGAFNIQGGTVVSPYYVNTHLLTAELGEVVDVNVSGSYDLFSFSAMNTYGGGPLSFSIASNSGTEYSFDVGLGSYELKFFGFKLTAGETIRRMSFAGEGHPGLTNFQIGVSAVEESPSDVPEPASLALFSLAGAGLIAARRRKVW